jgi:hypothetical protein
MLGEWDVIEVFEPMLGVQYVLEVERGWAASPCALSLETWRTSLRQ